MQTISRFAPGSLALMGVMCAAAAVGAQSPASSAKVEVVTGARLLQIADSLPPAASRTAQLGKGGGYTYALTQRDSSGGVEAHRDWADMFVIQRGTATLFAGGTLEGGKESSPGEMRGGTIKGGARSALKPGDVVVIPAGVPHQMLLEPGHRVAYLAFKIANPESQKR